MKTQLNLSVQNDVLEAITNGRGRRQVVNVSEARRILESGINALESQPIGLVEAQLAHDLDQVERAKKFVEPDSRAERTLDRLSREGRTVVQMRLRDWSHNSGDELVLASNITKQAQMAVDSLSTGSDVWGAMIDDGVSYEADVRVTGDALTVSFALQTYSHLLRRDQLEALHRDPVATKRAWRRAALAGFERAFAEELEMVDLPQKPLNIATRWRDANEKETLTIPALVMDNKRRLQSLCDSLGNFYGDQLKTDAGYFELSFGVRSNHIEIMISPRNLDLWGDYPILVDPQGAVEKMKDNLRREITDQVGEALAQGSVAVTAPTTLRFVWG